MPESAFNVLGSSIGQDALRCGTDGCSIRGCVTGINPLFISEGEEETLISDRADWIIVDTAHFSCGVESDISDEITALAKFLKKNWHRKTLTTAALQPP